MSLQKPLTIEVGFAFRLRIEEQRASALHRLVQSVISALYRDNQEDKKDRLVARYGVLHRKLRERSAQRVLTEVDVAAYAGGPDREQAICAFAIMFDLPIEMAEASLLSMDPGLLLLACRSENFAWSTVDRLLALHSQHTDDRLFMLQCCDDYHMILVADARRFMRLVRINLNSRSAVQTEAGLRTNVR